MALGAIQVRGSDVQTDRRFKLRCPHQPTRRRRALLLGFKFRCPHQLTHTHNLMNDDSPLTSLLVLREAHQTSEEFLERDRVIGATESNRSHRRRDQQGPTGEAQEGRTNSDRKSFGPSYPCLFAPSRRSETLWTIGHPLFVTFWCLRLFRTSIRKVGFGFRWVS